MARRQDFRRIGLLLPSSSSVQEQDLCKVLPEDITLHVARMRLSNVEAESTLRIVQEIEIESQKLADVDVDVIVFPATAPSSRNGIGYDQELIKRINAASGKPSQTASTALLEASQRLLKQTESKSSPRRRWGFIRNLEIGLLDPQTALDVGRRVNRPGADAVILACGNWSTFSIIDQLERDLGKPVLTTNQVSLWHALKMMKRAPLGGLGVLLREHLGDDAARYTVRAGT